MNKRRKGFTLIELLAVIVILGLLMAIAIPSVTKYITQSRKKTVSTTIGNYMSALTNQVNDMEYTFTATNTIYAVPIECIALERGGTNPFGKWHQANNAYWAYVLVQYDDSSSSYTYGFTFKDSAGYGLYPTTSEKLKESGSQILTDLSLTRPTSGKITNITAKDNWTGFNVTNDTNLVVLVASSEGGVGNGSTTCTLAQKGDNYAQVEEEKANAGGGEGNVVTCDTYTDFTVTSSNRSMVGWTNITTDLSIPETFVDNGTCYRVTSIGNNAFFGITNLKTVTIPASVTSLGSSAFSGCSSLSRVVFYGSSISCGMGTFNNTALTTISVTNIYPSSNNNVCGIKTIYIN